MLLNVLQIWSKDCQQQVNSCFSVSRFGQAGQMVFDHLSIRRTRSLQKDVPSSTRSNSRSGTKCQSHKVSPPTISWPLLRIASTTLSIWKAGSETITNLYLKWQGRKKNKTSSGSQNSSKMTGGSYACDTACSSSLVASHLGKVNLLEQRWDPLEWHLGLGTGLTLTIGSFIGGCAASEPEVFNPSTK